MTVYNNPYLQVQQGFLKNNPAFNDEVLGDFGSVPVSMTDEQETYQWNLYFSVGAKVAVSSGINFPVNASSGSIESCQGKKQYFNALIELNEIQYKSFMARSEAAVEVVAAKMQDVVFSIKRELQQRCIGKGKPASTADWPYDPDWKVFAYVPAADGNGTAELPIPFMEKVTPDAGSAGTPETVLAFPNIALGANQSVDFAASIMGPIIDGISLIVDTNTGRQLSKVGGMGMDTIIIHISQIGLNCLKRSKERDPEGNYTGKSAYQAMIEDWGVTFRVNREYTSATTSAGVHQFGVFVNPIDNFFLGFPKQLEVDGFYLESTNGQKKAIQRYIQPVVTGVRPYKCINSSGTTQYFRGYLEASFVHSTG